MADYSAFFSDSWHLSKQAGLYLPRPNPTFANPRWEQSSMRVLILRLSPFHDVDRSTPHLFLAQAVRSAVPGAYIDFCFFPSRHDRQLLEARNIPLIIGIESWRSFEEFDLALASCSYHLELLNLPYLLLRSGIPARASQRGQELPILLLGGSSALACQAAITPDGDCLADGIFFGEGEEQVQRLIGALAESRGEPKQARLRAAAESVAGFWPAGDLTHTVKQAVCLGPAGSHLTLRYPVLPGPEAGTARLQITYGCPFDCSFCFEGYAHRPYRRVAKTELLEAARSLKRNSGASTLELFSFNFNTHPDIAGLILELNRLYNLVNFMSQRADILNASPELLEAEVLAGKRSFTLGIEGVSERQRSFMQKSLTEAQVRELMARLIQAGVREAKLFYLLSGYENSEDFTEFRQFLGWLRGEQTGSRSGVRIIFSFNRLMRMPLTPLRHDRLFLDESQWRPLIEQARSACANHGFEFRLASSWAEYAFSQVLVSGGYWLHEPLELLAEQGLCFDQQLPSSAWKALSEWMQAHGQLETGLLEEKPKGYPFPLSFVQSTASADLLYRRYIEAKEALRSAGSKIARAASAITIEPEYLSRLEALMRGKRRLIPFYARIQIPKSVAGASPEWLNAWLMRELLLAHPHLADNLLNVRESLFGAGRNQQKHVPWYGFSIFFFTAWDPEAVLEALKQNGGVGEVPPSFSPGEFKSLRMVVHLPASFFPDAAGKLLAFLAGKHAPVTVRKEGAGYRLEAGEKARKKRVLFDGCYEQTPEALDADLSVGAKFDLVAFLSSFPEPEAYRQALVEIKEIEPG